MSENLPELPYAGSSGWSGSDASRERAEREDGNGVTGQRQYRVMDLLDIYGDSGLTWKELASVTGWHHGQATAPLSVLHKQGHIARLTEKRDRCSVYVRPEYVNGRDTVPQGRRREATPAETNAELEELRAKLARVEELVAPKWRSYSYTRDDLLDDIRRALV